MSKIVVSLLAAAAAAVTAGCSGVELPAADARAMGSCSSYSSQTDAQIAWENAGRPTSKDPDKDGQVCESLPDGAYTGGKPAKGDASSSEKGNGDPANCKTTDKIVEIGLSKTKHADVLAHARDAGKKGYGKVLPDSPYPVWTINRAGADERRDALLADIPTKPSMDRDEAPPAATRDQVKASVRYIESSQNRSAGAILGAKMRQWCSGVKIRYIGY